MPTLTSSANSPPALTLHLKCPADGIFDFNTPLQGYVVCISSISINKKMKLKLLKYKNGIFQEHKTDSLI